MATQATTQSINSLFDDAPMQTVAGKTTRATVSAYAQLQGIGKRAALLGLLAGIDYAEIVTDADYAPIYSGAAFEAGESPTVPHVAIDGDMFSTMIG